MIDPHALLQLQESRNYSIWGRLAKRFKLIGQSDNYKGSLVGLVVPTTDADELARTIKPGASSANATAGQSGTFTLATVPAGKRWLLHSLYVNRTSGDNTFNAVSLRDTVLSANAPIYTGTSLTTWTSEIFGHAIPMDQTQSIVLGLDGAGVSASAFSFSYWFEETDAF